MTGPRRIAIIGSGPSGLFATQSLVSQDRVEVLVDIFDRLPAPFGLLRYGVAPDHASIKAIATALARVFDSPHVRFLGLVELGRELSVADLTTAYDAVIYAAGASEDRRMHVPGENLPGSRSAREFVAWYSGHPDAEPQYLDGVRTAVTVGVGNVAIDVARMLLKTADELSGTDMPLPVLAELATHQVEDVWVIGRRGPEHASFTTTELRELLNTPDLAVSVEGCDLAAIDDAVLDRRTRANVAALVEAVGRSVEHPRARLRFLFWHQPLRLAGEQRVEAVVLERTEPEGPGRVRGTGVETVVEAQLVLRAIGYRGVPLPGVPFDEATGRIPNLAGRVCESDGTIRPGEYAVGWIKRGPIGVIGTNKADAAETVAALLDDLSVAESVGLDTPDEMLAARGITWSTLGDWQRIDSAEQSLGSSEGRHRTKIEAWHELLDLVRLGQPGGPPSLADEVALGHNGTTKQE